MRFRVRAKPNTTYLVQRAADLGRAGSTTASASEPTACRPGRRRPSVRAGIRHLPASRGPCGPLVSFATNASGEGSLDYNFDTPQITRGTRFDLRMRLVDDENAPTSDLRSGCMTIVVN